jgi:hypothetical protein
LSLLWVVRRQHTSMRIGMIPTENEKRAILYSITCMCGPCLRLSYECLCLFPGTAVATDAPSAFCNHLCVYAVYEMLCDAYTECMSCGQTRFMWT